MNKLQLRKVIKFNADRSKVWDALVNPEIIKEYLFGTEVISDWEVGSRMIFHGEWNGSEFNDKGNILAIEPEKLLKYNYWSIFSGLDDKEENYSVITYQLKEEGGQTVLLLTQEGFNDKHAKEHSEMSWDMILEKMKEIVEE